MKKYITLTTIAVIAALGLTGCSQPAPVPEPTKTVTPTPTPKPALTSPIMIGINVANGLTIKADQSQWIVVELDAPNPETMNTFNDWVCETSNSTTGTCENPSFNAATGVAMNGGVSNLTTGKATITFTNIKTNQKVAFDLIVS